MLRAVAPLLVARRPPQERRATGVEGAGVGGVGEGVVENEADAIRASGSVDRMEATVESAIVAAPHRVAVDPVLMDGNATVCSLSFARCGGAAGAGGEQFPLAVLTALPHRPTAWITYRAQAAGAGHDRLADGAVAADLVPDDAALVDDRRPPRCGGAVDPAPPRSEGSPR